MSEVEGRRPAGRGRRARGRKCGRLLFLLALVISGCAHVPQLPKVEPCVTGATPGDPWCAAPVWHSGLEVAGQYACSTDKRIGYNTFEVYLANLGPQPVVFRSCWLNGTMRLPVMRTSVVKGMTGITLGGEEMPLPSVTGSRLATWWQFYPAPEVAPGDTATFQINFRERPSAEQTLRLETADGQSVDVAVPAFMMPEKLITAITYTRDYRRLFVQYRAGSEPKALWVNNRRATEFMNLRPTGRAGPGMLAIDPPTPIRSAAPLYVKIEFADGRWRHALVRALSGVSLDYRECEGLTRRTVRANGLDTDPPVRWLPHDVACDDFNGKKGGSAWAVILDRIQDYDGNREQLVGVGYCAAMFRELWNIYGQMADAVYVKPYRLGFGQDPLRFIEDEDEAIELARASTAPRPFLWIPYAFNTRGRYLEAEELRVLAWAALARGCKGIRYHFRMAPREEEFVECPGLLVGLRDLNRQVREREDVLSPLVLVSERVIGDESGHWVREYVSWAGDMGLLIMLRNLHYRTDAQPDNGGREPRFRIEKDPSFLLELALPEWLRLGDVRDFLTGESVAAEAAGGTLAVPIEKVGAFKLLWLENRGKG